MGSIIEEIKLEGRAEGKASRILRLLKMGLSQEQVVEAAEMAEEEIQEIAKAAQTA